MGSATELLTQFSSRTNVLSGTNQPLSGKDKSVQLKPENAEQVKRAMRENEIQTAHQRYIQADHTPQSLKYKEGGTELLDNSLDYDFFHEQRPIHPRAILGNPKNRNCAVR